MYFRKKSQGQTYNDEKHGQNRQKNEHNSWPLKQHADNSNSQFLSVHNISLYSALQMKSAQLWEEGHLFIVKPKGKFSTKQSLRGFQLPHQNFTLSEPCVDTWQADHQKFLPNNAKG